MRSCLHHWCSCTFVHTFRLSRPLQNWWTIKVTPSSSGSKLSFSYSSHLLFLCLSLCVFSSYPHSFSILSEILSNTGGSDGVGTGPIRNPKTGASGYEDEHGKYFDGLDPRGDRSGSKPPWGRRLQSNHTRGRTLIFGAIFQSYIPIRVWNLWFSQHSGSSRRLRLSTFQGQWRLWGIITFKSKQIGIMPFKGVWQFLWAAPVSLYFFGFLHHREDHNPGGHEIYFGQNPYQAPISASSALMPYVLLQWCQDGWHGWAAIMFQSIEVLWDVCETE